MVVALGHYALARPVPPVPKAVLGLESFAPAGGDRLVQGADLLSDYFLAALSGWCGSENPISSGVP